METIGLNRAKFIGMFYDANLAIPDNSDWAIRSHKWQLENDSAAPKRKRRDRNETPLILCGHGISIRVEGGALVIRGGFTHYPQDQATQRFFPGHRETPTRIIILDGSGTLSFAVAAWCAEQGVALARVSWTGEVVTIASGSGFAGDAKRIEWQHRTRADEGQRLAFSHDLIRRKLTASVDTLLAFVPPSKRRDTTLAFHARSIEAMASGALATVNDIRGLEGQCASGYFLAWEGLAIEWIGDRPVPPNWRQFQSRSSLAKSGLKPCNRNASHPINAMLNYAYAVTLAKLQIDAIAEGYDLTLGIFHHGKKGNNAYAFDLIEPERPKVDAAVLQFVASRQFAVADFILRKDGVCRLCPQLARAVAALSTNELSGRTEAPLSRAQHRFQLKPSGQKDRRRGGKSVDNTPK